MIMNLLPLENVTADCTAITTEPMSVESADKLARTLRAIADPGRLRLISIIASGDRGEACVCDLIEPLGLGQPTVSHHLKILADAGILEREKRGRWAYYRVVPGALESIGQLLVSH